MHFMIAEQQHCLAGYEQLQGLYLPLHRLAVRIRVIPQGNVRIIGLIADKRFGFFQVAMYVAYNYSYNSPSPSISPVGALV
jgi:hypothetical protein